MRYLSLKEIKKVQNKFLRKEKLITNAQVQNHSRKYKIPIKSLRNYLKMQGYLSSDFLSDQILENTYKSRKELKRTFNKHYNNK